MTITSPAVVPPDINGLLGELPESVGSPVFVDIRPFEGAIVRDCYVNVKKQVAGFGGQIQHGWIVWEVSGEVLEAEFHAVWRDPSGALIDVTPQSDGEASLLFIPDTETIWSGVLVPKERFIRATCPPLIRRCMRINTLFEEFLSKCPHDDGQPIIVGGHLRRFSDRFKSWEKEGLTKMARDKFGLTVNL